MASVLQPASADPGLVVPAYLAALNAYLVEFAVREISSRSGGMPRMADIGELRALLRSGAASAASAAGTPPRIMDPQPPRELTTAQAAAVMEISARRVRYLAAAGGVIARKVAGRDWLVDADSARGYSQRRRTA
jgi:hypothetical protein